MTGNNTNNQDNSGERRQPTETGLRARTDRTLIRSTHRSERFVLVELDAPPATTQRKREPVNVAFVLDRSGSMGGRKIELARRAIETAIGRLLPEDRFAVVAYDDHIDVVVESTPASREAKDGAIGRVRRIDARGSTNLGGGWLKGAEQVAMAQAAAGGSGVHRVLLLTDGLANQGITDAAELARHAGELRAHGISMTTFGVGEDFDETLLQGMADAGGGHFYYIERPEQITDLIASEVGELDRARALCEKLIALASPLQLYAEEIDASTGRHLGNFPQAFTHLALINAVMKLIAAEEAYAAEHHELALGPLH